MYHWQIAKYAKYLKNMQNIKVKIKYAEYALPALLMTQANQYQNPDENVALNSGRQHRFRRAIQSIYLVITRTS